MQNTNIKKRLFVIGLIIFIYILFMGVGYAFFSESLTINGVASTVDYYEGDKLPVEAVIRDTEQNRYYTADNEKNHVVFNSETWQDDTYTLKLKKEVGVVIGEKTITYVVTFKNPTTTTFTNGTINAEITKNTNNHIKEVSGSLSKTEINPGDQVDVSFTIRSNFLTTYGEDSVKATITYTYQNKPRYFYFIVDYIN